MDDGYFTLLHMFIYDSISLNYYQNGKRFGQKL